MESDRELLELAAKAAGIELPNPALRTTHERGVAIKKWNPLADDGDALRLAVKFSQMDGGIAIMLSSRFNSAGFAQCFTNKDVVAPMEHMADDPYAATRRAIVRAAAEIGRSMS